jgi:hypothetical protein
LNHLEKHKKVIYITICQTFIFVWCSRARTTCMVIIYLNGIEQSWSSCVGAVAINGQW